LCTVVFLKGCVVFQSDIYSYGVVVWELWSRMIPFEAYRTRVEIERAILNNYQLPKPHQPNPEVE